MKRALKAVILAIAAFVIPCAGRGDGKAPQDNEASMEHETEPMPRSTAAAILGKRIIFNNNGEATTVSLQGDSASPEMFRALEAFPELYGLGVLDADVELTAVTHALEELSGLTYVTFVRCSNINDRILPVVAALPKLHDADFEGCRITDEGLPSLLASQSLVAVSVCETAITDMGVATLAKLPTLGRLHITNTAVTDAGLEALRGHDRLAVVWASGTKIGDEGLAHLATCPALQEVLARRTCLTDAGVEAISKAKKLSLLQASGKFSRRSLAALATCGELRSFLLEGELDLGDDDIKIFAAFNRLRFIGVRGSRISKEGEARIKELLPKTRIDISPPE